MPVPVPTKGNVLVRTVASVVSAGTEGALVEFAAKGMLGKARARPDLVRQTLEKVRKEGLLSALQAVRTRLEQRIPLGYSSAGVVEEIGAEVYAVQPGDRVACAGGGKAVHAEYAVVPINLIAKLPQSVDFDTGATATLGAISLHAFRLAGPQVGERVAVIGLGLLGQLAMQIARAAGCEAFGVDVDAGRVALARQLGGSAVPRVEAIESGESFTNGRGFDAVLIYAHAVDSDPLQLAGHLTRDRARVVLVGVVGMEVPRGLYYEKELSLVVSRSYGPGRYDAAYEEAGKDYPIGYVRWTEQRNIEAFLELAAGGQIQVGPLITHRFPIERADEAYELITGHAAEPKLGVMLTYPDDSPKERKLDLPTGRGRKEATVRLGAVGAGNFARRVSFPAISRLKNVELVGLATASGVSSAESGKRYGFTYASTDTRAILEDDQINTVAIFTRHHQHAKQAAEALQAGKHVFCEKPLAIDESGLEAVVKAIETAENLLTVGFNRRFAPMAIAMRDHLATAGEPLSVQYRVNAGALPLDHWVHDPAQGGGRIIGEVCHFVDFLTFLIGAPPTRVRTWGLPNRGRYLGDNVHITLDFPDGSIGTIDYLANGDPAFPKERIEAFGGGRVAVLDDFRSLELVSGGKAARKKSGQNRGHREIWAAFTASIQEAEPPPIRYADLIGVTRSTFAAVDSLRTGRSIELEPLVGPP